MREPLKELSRRIWIASVPPAQELIERILLGHRKLSCQPDENHRGHYYEPVLAELQGKEFANVQNRFGSAFT
jgi:hypothetical protein